MSLKINNLSKNYDGTWIIKDISFAAHSGEILGVFGTTGSGKSVLMRLIAGIEKSDSGDISSSDKDVTEMSCEDRGFQFPSLSNESFWQKLFGSKESELADGEGQILALENVLEEADGVLLLDNSFCQMDKNTKANAYKKLKQVTKEKNLTVIFATNDYDEIFQVCNRVAILSNKEIKQIGTPKEIYENPNSKAVAEIFGENNLFLARRLTSNKSSIPEFLTLEGEHKLTTAQIDKKKLGTINQNIFLSIRPEQVVITSGASFPEDNLLKAKVTDIKFLGSTTKIYLDSEGLELKSKVLRVVGLNVGDECVVGLPPNRINVLKE